MEDSDYHQARGWYDVFCERLERIDINENSVLSKSDLTMLQRKAERFASPSNFLRTDWFYRNKSVDYFDKVLYDKKGIMEVYIKDDNGDPRSSINGRLHGLFFCASVDSQTGRMLPRSPFGPRRLCIAPAVMFNSAPNLFFADFYCNHSNRPHYVTLVMTTPNSQADRFCQRHLIPLNIHDNRFLYFNEDEEQAYVYSTSTYEIRASRMVVEVFFTENIDVRGLMRSGDATLSDCVSTGLSKPEGIPKRASCTICNV